MLNAGRIFREFDSKKFAKSESLHKAFNNKKF